MEPPDNPVYTACHGIMGLYRKIELETVSQKFSDRKTPPAPPQNASARSVENKRGPRKLTMSMHEWSDQLSKGRHERHGQTHGKTYVLHGVKVELDEFLWVLSYSQ